MNQTRHFFSSIILGILMLIITFLATASATHSYLSIPRSNLYNGVHIRNDRDDLTGVYPYRHVRPRPYRGYPYSQPDPLSADLFALYTGEAFLPQENSAPLMDLRTINRFRPHNRFW